MSEDLGVYSDTGMLDLVEEALETPPESPNEEIGFLKDKIDANFDMLYNLVQSLKSSDLEMFQYYTNHYNKMSEEYKYIGSIAFMEQADPAQVKEHIANLNKMLTYTDELTDAINNDREQRLSQAQVEVPIEDEGTVPMPQHNTTTAMVVSSGQAGTAPAPVEMENVGMARAYWTNMGPVAKGAGKIAMVAGAIYGGKKLWEFIQKKAKEK